MQPLRVLHVIPAIASCYGGPSQAVLGMVRASREAGIEAEVVATNAAGPGKRIPLPTGGRILVEDAPCTLFPSTCGESLKYSRQLAGWISEQAERFDLLHIHGILSHAPIAAARIAAARGIPYLIRPLGSLSDWGLRQRALRKRLFLRCWGLHALRRAVALHYTSIAERVDVERRFGFKHGLVIPLGVSQSASSLSRPEVGPALFLFLGRIHPVKRIELIIRAIARLRGLSPDCNPRLVVAGEGQPEYVEALKRLAREVGVCAEFVGWVAGKRKAALLGSACALILVSAQENFGVAIAEAMSAGVPVVVSKDVDLALEVEGSGGGIAVAPEPEALAVALLGLATDAQRRQGMGERARAHAMATWSWTTIAQRLRGVYEAILSGTWSAGPP